ncbi:histone acetyltransferase p300-like [Drosophila subpulchrella]|uniref:histone acetyltransferase p300-like n=1 Tax=Drosophila subpulchrella TaxID=1486046 RepID=UPI0018A19221|nr:histone acetyltransferase p300-like [Drosophila subpulchrella]
MEADGPSSGVDQDQSGGNSPQEGSVVPAVPGGQYGGAHLNVDEDRKLQVRRQLLLLIHGHWCRQEDCPIRDCWLIKTVLGHMTTCSRALDCPWDRCFCYRTTLLHYRNCRDRVCIICSINQRRAIVIPVTKYLN